jgi:hypothetical protein
MLMSEMSAGKPQPEAIPLNIGHKINDRLASNVIRKTVGLRSRRLVVIEDLVENPYCNFPVASSVPVPVPEKRRR